MPVFHLFRTLSVLLSLALAVAWDLRVGYSELRVVDSWSETIEAGSQSARGEVQKQRRRTHFEGFAGFGTTIRAGSGQADEPTGDDEPEHDGDPDELQQASQRLFALSFVHPYTDTQALPARQGPSLHGLAARRGLVMRARSQIESEGDAHV